MILWRSCKEEIKFILLVKVLTIIVIHDPRGIKAQNAGGCDEIGAEDQQMLYMA